MKKGLVVVLVLMLILGCGSFASALGLYPLTAVVVNFDYDEDVVICADFNGNEWLFAGIEDWMVGDLVSFIMDDFGTDEIFDDAIIDYAYSGWVDLADWFEHLEEGE